MGARRVLALINRRAYADLVQGTQIDIAISPAHTVIGELLAYVRRGDVAGRAQPAPRRRRGAGRHRPRRRLIPAESRSPSSVAILNHIRDSARIP